MIKVILFVLFTLVVLAVSIFVLMNIEHDRFIKKMANEHTIEQIRKKISHATEQIDGEKFKGQMLEDLLDIREMWEKIRDYKLKHK